ncbi:MAG TPA: tetratricopeptide repeat protein [Candidatus Obscuribacterales bacterium]
MHRKLTLTALAAIACLAGAVIPANSQERTNPQYVEPFVEDAMNRNTGGEMPLMEDPSRVRWTAYFNSGEANRLQGNFPAALRDFDRALALNPNAYEVYISRAKTYDKMGMYDRVIQNYDVAIAMHPKLERVWLARSAFFVRRKQAAEALRDLDEGLRFLPYSPNLRVARGSYYMNRLAYGRAVPDFDVAIQVKPTMMVALEKKAVCEKHLQHYPALEQTLSKIIAIDGRREAAWYERAQVHRHYNRLTQADADLSHALNLNPRLLKARFQRGQIRMEMAKAKPEMCSPAINDLKLACRQGEKSACKMVRKPSCSMPKPAATMIVAPVASSQPSAPASPPASTAPVTPASNPPASPVPKSSPAGPDTSTIKP